MTKSFIREVLKQNKNMKVEYILTLGVVAIITIVGCNNNYEIKRRELELKEKELSLREKELSLKEVVADISKPVIVTVDSVVKIVPRKSQLSNVENLIGNWFVPHMATINMRFNRNGRFEFNDYNSTFEKEELLTGEYKLLNGILTLMYDDRAKQNFKFYKGEGNDYNYYIKKGDYYFVKGETGEY